MAIYLVLLSDRISLVTSSLWPSLARTETEEASYLKTREDPIESLRLIRYQGDAPV